MKVGIDAHVLGTRAGGNESYMRNLLRALAAIAPDEELLAFVNRSRLESPQPAEGLPAVPLPLRSSYLRVPLLLPWLARQHRLDVLHVQYTAPFWTPCPYVVSMHDVVALRLPESMPFLDRHRLRHLSPRTLRRAARIFVLTRAVQQQIMEAYGIPEDRFDLVQPALEPRFRPLEDPEAADAIRARYGLPEKYVLYLGLLQPRKNLLRLAQAFAQMVDQGHPHHLVIAGREAWMHREMLQAIRSLNLGRRLQFTGYVPPEDLPTLLGAADVFAYVSLYEGFGIPVLEALACGVPTLSSTDPALLEVAGGAALAVEATEVEAIAQGLGTLLSDESLRARLRTMGPERATSFTLEQMGRNALAGYRKAFS